ncbi:MAG: hypothetical protein ACXAC7_03195 [Candidatus Hodarchaeales archaeon]|jgi:hypothetical protein
MAKMTLVKVFSFIVLLSCISGAFIFQGTGMSITNTSVNAQSSDTPFKAIWTDEFNNLLENSSTVEGPHAKVKVSWPDPVDHVNLTYEKGEHIQTKNLPYRGDVQRKDIPFSVTQGDSYNITYQLSDYLPIPDEGTTFIFNMALIDPSNNFLRGCDRSTFLEYNATLGCPKTLKQEINEFVPQFTGSLTISIWSPYVRASMSTILRYINLTVSNYEYHEYNSSTSFLTVNTADTWNSNLNLTSTVEVDGTVYSSNINLFAINWFPPTIGIFTLDEDNDRCRSLERSSSHLLTWDVTDGNVPLDESLSFNLTFKAYSNDSELKLLTNTNQTSYSWNSTSNSDYPNGSYAFILTVSDGTFIKDQSLEFFLNLDISIYPDSDQDGMNTTWECQMGLNPHINDAALDKDHDGLTNLEESLYGTYAINADTDADGMSDWYEVYMSLNLSKNDSFSDYDGDGLPNIWEYQNDLNASDPTDASMDYDHDGMPNLWEYQMGLNATSIFDYDQDLDGDGLPNLWEYKMGLNATDETDAPLDTDGDGIPNLWEFWMSLNATNPSDADFDSDGDGLPNRWEYQMSLNTANPEDAVLDKDNDGLPNLWEYQMGLNPLFNDATKDLDSDGLTNLEEYLFKSWANQSDTDSDGIDDLYEFQKGLNVTFNDALLDLDNDGLPNLWEYQNNFDLADSSDANADFDGDGLSNLVEFTRGTDPYNQWSFPLNSLSIYHQGIVLILLVALLSIFSLITFQIQKRRSLTKRLEAPNYSTALKIKTAECADYSSYLEANSETKILVEKASGTYLQNDASLATLQYEQALTRFETLDDQPSIALTVFLVARLQQENNILTPESSILRRFPSQPFEDSSIKAFDHMIQALLAEIRGYWGVAKSNWELATNTEDLLLKYRMLSLGALIELDFRDWVSSPSDTGKELLIAKLDDWQKSCEENNFLDQLCHVYLLRAKIHFTAFEFPQAEDLLNKSLNTAQKANLTLYQERTREEIETLNHHKHNILTLMKSGELLSPEEEQRQLQAYLTKALFEMKKETMKKEDAN